MVPIVQPNQATKVLNFNAFFEELKSKASNKHNKSLLEDCLISKSTNQLVELFNITNSSSDNNITKLLALVIIKKIAQEAIEEFEEEQDPQNKLDILRESIFNIKKIQENLVKSLPEIDSTLFKQELKLPAADFAHFQDKDGKKVGDILDSLANKAFKLAYQTSKVIIKSKEIEEQIFKPIFTISKNLKIGYEERWTYINKIKENIKKVDNTEKITTNLKSQDVHLVSTELAQEIFKDPKKALASNIMVYARDTKDPKKYIVRYLMIKVQGIIKKYYLRNQEQYQACNKFVTDILNVPKTPKTPKSPTLVKTKKLDKNLSYLNNFKDNQDIVDCFDSLIGANLKYPESQCKVANNEFSGFINFYIQQQKLNIEEINAYLEKFYPLKNSYDTNFPTKNADETPAQFNLRACEELHTKIIPAIKMLLIDLNKKSSKPPHLQIALDNMNQTLSNYHLGYRSVSLLAKNYESIKTFEQTTLKTWESSSVTGYEKNINKLLDSIRLSCNKFGYHKGYIIYLANYRLDLKVCKKTPTIVYDQITKKILYLIANNGKENIKVPLSKLTLSTQQKFNHFIRQNALKSSRSFGRVFLDYQNKLTSVITSMPVLKKEKIFKNFIYAPTQAEQSLHKDLKRVVADSTVKRLTRGTIFKDPTGGSSIRKLKFSDEDKFLIIKDAKGEVNIVHHHGGNRLYRPQDILPASKHMPTALLLLGIGHFGDVKAGFLPSGEQKAIKVVRIGSTNSAIKRQFYKEVWDEREDDLEREINGLKENKKLIACGVTRSYLKKITKTKKELLNFTEEKVAVTDMQTRRLIRNRHSDGEVSTTRSSISSQQEEEQQNLMFMEGKATHILMDLSGPKDLRDEIEEISKNTFPTEEQGFKKYFSYFIDRAIECCDILEEQHKTGIHNDFKPANIAISRDGSLEIIDFGTYQQNNAVTSKKQPLNPMVHGTPAFMSPSSLKEIQQELEAQSIQTKLLFGVPSLPPQVYTANNLKEYYIKRRLNDVLGDQNTKIKNIQDIQQLIIKVLNASYSPVSVYNRHSKNIQKAAKTANSNIQSCLQNKHQSKEQYTFKSANRDSKSQNITWTIKDEIAFILKAIETTLKARPSSRQFSMECNNFYDIYSLVSMISGTAKKDAYLTNIILRYGNLHNEDLCLMIGNDQDSTCPIQNYLGEGQGLRLDNLFNDIIKNFDILQLTSQQQQDFNELYNRWIRARNDVLLSQNAEKNLEPRYFKKILDNFKEIFFEFKKIILGVEATVTDKISSEITDQKMFSLSKELEEFLKDTIPQEHVIELEKLLDLDNLTTENVEKILMNQSKPRLLALKRCLTRKSQDKPDKIDFIIDLCYNNYPNTFSSVILKLFDHDPDKKQKAILNFYKILINIVFPVEDPEDDDMIAKNRKLAAGIFFASMPVDYDVNLLPQEIKKYLTINELETIKMIQKTIADTQSNIFDTIFSVANVSIFQEEFINIIRQSVWNNIDARSFFNKKEYESNLLALIKHDKVKLFDKLFAVLSPIDKQELNKELLWVYAVAKKVKSKNIIKYLENKLENKLERKKLKQELNILLDKNSILEFMLKQFSHIDGSKMAAITSNSRKSLVTRRRTSHIMRSKADLVVPAPALQQSGKLDLSVCDKDMLNTLILATNKAKIHIPSKPSLIEQFIEDLENAKKLKESTEQKEADGELLGYKNTQQKSDLKFQLQIAWNALKKAQGAYDRLRLYEEYSQPKKQDYRAAWNILKKAQGAYDRLRLYECTQQQETEHNNESNIKNKDYLKI